MADSFVSDDEETTNVPHDDDDDDEDDFNVGGDGEGMEVEEGKTVYHKRMLPYNEAFL